MFGPFLAGESPGRQRALKLDRFSQQGVGFFPSFDRRKRIQDSRNASRSGNFAG